MNRETLGLNVVLPGLIWLLLVTCCLCDPYARSVLSVRSILVCSTVIVAGVFLFSAVMFRLASGRWNP